MLRSNQARKHIHAAKSDGIVMEAGSKVGAHVDDASGQQAGHAEGQRA